MCFMCVLNNCVPPFAECSYKLDDSVWCLFDSFIHRFIHVFLSKSRECLLNYFIFFSIDSLFSTVNHCLLFITKIIYFYIHYEI